MSKRAIFLTAALLCAGTTSVAQNAATPAKPASQPAAAQPEIQPLGLGDKAPTLKLAKFVKGDPLTGFEKGKTYVVEFWATWCGPCKASIPHLTELQKEYKGKVTFLGVSVWESDQSKVEPFVTTEMGDKMVYTVAMDEVPALPDGVKPGTREAQSFAYNNGAMSKSWMQAAGQGGIPSAFIVNGEGRIAWIGHPMNIEEPLAQVTAGTWDIEKAKAEAEAEKKAEAEQAQKMAGINKGMQEFNAALKAKDYAKVSSTGAALMNDPNANEQVMNFIAWSIVDPEGGVEKKDLDLAMKAATKGCELSGWKDGMVIDTLARVYFVKGDLSKAVELQTKAVANSEGDMKAQIEGTLKEYQDALAKQRH